MVAFEVGAEIKIGAVVEAVSGLQVEFEVELVAEVGAVFEPEIELEKALRKRRASFLF